MKYKSVTLPIAKDDLKKAAKWYNQKGFFIKKEMFSFTMERAVRKNFTTL